jgi:hypothetical protein
METNPFKHMLMYLMSHIGMPAEPVIYEDLCTATGQFTPVSLFQINNYLFTIIKFQ